MKDRCPDCQTPIDAGTLFCVCGRPLVLYDDPPPARIMQATTLEAFHTSRELAKSTRGLIIRYLGAREAVGATDQEMQDALDIGPQSQTPARRKLAQDHLVADSGKKRLTRSGRKAIVWIRTDLASDYASARSTLPAERTA